MKRFQKITVMYLLCITTAFLAGCGNPNPDLSNSVSQANNPSTLVTETDTLVSSSLTITVSAAEESIHTDAPVISESQISNMSETGIFYANDDCSYEDSITEEYPREQLISFFHDYMMTRKEFLLGNSDGITIQEVHEMFPIQVLRTKDYTIYKATSGELFYVFWDGGKDEMAEDGTVIGRCYDHATVYGVLILKDLLEEDDFSVLTPGVSNAFDVLRIDPGMELFAMFSSRLASFHLLKDGSRVFISYPYVDGFDSLYDFVISDIRIVPPDEHCPGCCSWILADDLPDSQ